MRYFLKTVGGGGSLFLAMLFLAAEPATAQINFQLLEPPVPCDRASFSLSADGSSMGCRLGEDIFWWTRDQGFRFVAPGVSGQRAVAMSGGGNALLASTPVHGGSTAAIWYADGTSMILEPPVADCRARETHCWGRDLSADGGVIIGGSQQCGTMGSFVWNRQSGISPLQADEPATGFAVAGDGKTIAGHVQIPGSEHTRPALWQAGNPPEIILAPEARGTAVNISQNGRFVVGTTSSDHATEKAFIWSREDGSRILEHLKGHQADPTRATAVSNHGIVVGSCGDEITGNQMAFIWSTTTGMRAIGALLADHQVSVPPGLTLTGAQDISADSRTIVGTCRDAEYRSRFWMVRLDDPALLQDLAGPLARSENAPAPPRIRPEFDEADMLLPFPFGKRAHRKMPRP